MIFKDSNTIVYVNTTTPSEVNYLINSELSRIIYWILRDRPNTLNTLLDLTVTKHIDKLKFNIYRKPTTTDVTIPVDSHHPFSQKMAAFNCFIHRLLTGIKS